MNVISKILLSSVFLFSFSSYAKNYSVKVSEKNNLQLSSQDWVEAKGSFIPGATPMNIYSHKKKKEHHLFYEDLFIPKAALKDRLPKDCLKLVESFESSCVSEKSSADGTTSVNVTSVFKLSVPDVVKVRTVVVNGKKADVKRIVDYVKGLSRVPASVKVKGAR
jgi:hypothetical protein